MNTQTSAPTVQTIDIQAKEWFDKINGNSYFAGLITVNFGMPTEKRYTMPFQYGYGSQYEQEAREILINKGLIPTKDSYELRQSGIIIRSSIQRNCKKRELKEFV
jgi:hypothetical protein